MGCRGFRGLLAVDCRDLFVCGRRLGYFRSFS